MLLGSWGMLGMVGWAAGTAIAALLLLVLPLPLRKWFAGGGLVAMAGGAFAVARSPFVDRHAAALSDGPMHVVARALVEGRGLLPVVFTSGALIALASVVVAWCERRGHDRSAPEPVMPPAQRSASLPASDLVPAAGSVSLVRDVQHVERLSFARQSDASVPWIACAFCALMFAPLFGRMLGDPIMALTIGFLVALLAFTLVCRCADMMVQRDLDARPLLMTLPITPHQTLRGKVAMLRLRLLPLFLLVGVMSVVCVTFADINPDGRPFEVAWRFAALMASIWLLCGAAVPVAFLSRGVGGSTLSGSGGWRNFATHLLSLPLFSTVASRTALDALVSIGLIGALNFEARRSAARCVQWIDDPADDAQDVPVWRALLVLATFFCVQRLTGQLLVLQGVSAPIAVAAAYAAASLVVLVLQREERERAALPRLVLMPRDKVTLLLGVAAGVLSGVSAQAVVGLATKLGWAPAGGAPLELQTVAGWMALLAIVVMAPVVEEMFFRGWLQSAIASQLPSARRWHAVVYTAAAFGAVHFGSLYLPQFTLGLLAGALFARGGGLLPAMLAHVVHNALGLLWPVLFG